MKPPLESKPTEALQIISGKHSWHIIDSKKGAKASAILYSIAETAKANGLNPFEYFKFLMEQLKEYPYRLIITSYLLIVNTKKGEISTI